MEGSPPWIYNITIKNIYTEETFAIKIKDCNNEYPPHPCENEEETTVRQTLPDEKVQISLNPNPVTNEINVIGVGNEPFSIYISDRSGKTVFKKLNIKNSIVDISELRVNVLFIATIVSPTVFYSQSIFINE